MNTIKYNTGENDLKNYEILKNLREEMYGKIFGEEHIKYANKFIQTYESNPELYYQEFGEYYKNLKEILEYFLKEFEDGHNIDFTIAHTKKISGYLVANNIDYRPNKKKSK